MAPAFSLLMVEDDLAARNIIVEMIQVKFPRCTIYTADNGREGLESFKRHAPSVVITDINMPEMDGIEMARAIRGLNPHTPFLVMTAYGDDQFKRSFSELGFCGFLVKPVNFKELFASIENCLAVSGQLGGDGKRQMRILR